MSDLAEFLLARITDDEEAVNDRTRRFAPSGWSYLEQFGDFGDDERWMIEIPAARVLAECKAKRRIVESCRVDYEDAQTSGDDGNTLAEEVLWALALPYAGHPDYREEWRPSSC